MLTATSPHKPQPHTTDFGLRGPWIDIIIFGILRVAMHMQRGGDDARTTGPQWDPAGNVPFRDLVRE
eukprot:622189-Pyramimonas_sp.AAC.1